MKALDAWEALRNYESRDIVDFWLRDHGEAGASEQRLQSIVSTFRQARSYFDSSLRSDISVKPLLLYYSALGLAQGCVLATNRGMIESQIEKGHGLRVIDSGNNEDISDMPIGILKFGSFGQFVKTTGNYTLCRNFISSDLGFVWRHSPIIPKQSIRFDSILSRIPDLLPQYVRWKKIILVQRIENIERTENSSIKIVFPNYAAGYQTTPESLRQWLSDCVNEAANWHENGLVFESAAESGKWPPIWYIHEGRQYSGFDGLVAYLIEPFDEGVDFSKPAATLLLAYSIGMLVRYYPSRWNNIVSGRLGDGALPTLLSAVSFIGVDFLR